MESVCQVARSSSPLSDALSQSLINHHLPNIPTHHLSPCYQRFLISLYQSSHPLVITPHIPVHRISIVRSYPSPPPPHHQRAYFSHSHQPDPTLPSRSRDQPTIAIALPIRCDTYSTDMASKAANKRVSLGRKPATQSPTDC